MKTFKTKKGTELIITQIKGKDYLQVAQRIIWFREERELFSIETEIVNLSEDSCLSKAYVKDESGRIIAMSHKFEDRVGFTDFIEKSETGAIGRALALCGFGTQFCADDLNEGLRLADAPIEKPKKEIKHVSNNEKTGAYNSFNQTKVGTNNGNRNKNEL